MRSILDIFEVFLGVFEKTKEKKDRVRLGARLRGRTATHASKEGSEKVLGRVAGSVLRRVLRRGLAMVLKGLLRRGCEKGVARRVPRTPPRRVRPLTRVPRKSLLRHFFCLLNLVRGDHPNSRKNAPRMQGQMKIFHVRSHQFREWLRELLRELWFSYCSSREMPFRERNFAFRESVSEFRELLREYPGTLPEPRE